MRYTRDPIPPSTRALDAIKRIADGGIRPTVRNVMRLAQCGRNIASATIHEWASQQIDTPQQREGVQHPKAIIESMAQTRLLIAVHGLYRHVEKTHDESALADAIRRIAYTYGLAPVGAKRNTVSGRATRRPTNPTNSTSSISRLSPDVSSAAADLTRPT